MKNLFARFSFKLWLMMAFLCMGLVFVAAYLIAVNTLDILSQKSQETAHQAVSLNELSLEIANVRESMERYALQYTILKDPEIFQDYLNAQNKSLKLIQTLLQRAVIEQQIAQQWEELSKQLTETLDHITPEIGLNDQEHALLNESFKTIEHLYTNIHLQIQYFTENKNKQLVNEISERQSWMSKAVTALIGLMILVSLALGTWLARPFKRIESAILKLGANQLDAPIDITGPADVRKLGQKLDWLRTRLAEIDADKARFLRHTSHEFKTPLAALREGISLLDEELTGKLNRDQKDVVHILQQNILILQNQIEDLLRYNAAAFDAQKLHRQSVDLLNIIEDQIEIQQLQLQSSHIEIVLDAAPVIAEVDAEKIAVAFGNLLSNAIRFSPLYGKIFIQLATHNQTILIDIQDQGPGIIQEDVPHIFDPFYRGKNQPDNKTRGSGIGLSIVQEFIMAHRGEILLIPSEQGSHFRIQLPYVN